MGTGGAKKISDQQKANAIVEDLEMSYQVYDNETGGNGKNLLKFRCVSAMNYEFKSGDEIWIMTLSRKKEK